MYTVTTEFSEYINVKCMILCKAKNYNGNRYRNINVYNILELLASPSILVELNYD